MRVVRDVISRRAILGGAAAAPLGAALPESGDTPRNLEAMRIRVSAARSELSEPFPAHQSNGDENLYPDRIANFTKGLPHDKSGRVDSNAYAALLVALESGRWEDFETIPLGCPDPALQRKLTNPMSGLAYDLQGPDSHQLVIPPAPALASAEQAAEAVELYWQALARDIPFSEYESSPVAQAAAAELTALAGFRGPRAGGAVTTATLFRGFTPGDLAGPYVSQFLLKPIAYGAQVIDQRVPVMQHGVDFLTEEAAWLEVQNGYAPRVAPVFSTPACYMRNGRDIARWVRSDGIYQAYFNACNVIVKPGDPPGLNPGGIAAPLNPGNPYSSSRTQSGFGTFGAPYIAAILGEVATRALKAVWYQKWFVHRRLRPEEYGGWVHQQLNGASLPLHPDAPNSRAVAEVRRRYGTYLLPQAYPEGSPLHPSYGAGHATVAGACVTVLKALFDETYVIQDPVVPAADGVTLSPYAGPDAGSLTVGGELNKLASNIAMARNFAGIHWRSDYAESLRLGQTVAIHLLREQRATYGEKFAGFTFTTFEGARVTV